VYKSAEQLIDDVLQKRINDLKDLVKIQCSDGNWNYDHYMHGMANGMLLSLNVMDDKLENPYTGTQMKYPFLDAPEEWISKKASNEKLIVAVDFDDTIAYKTENLEPQELLPCAKEVINWMYDNGCHIIIWTCRSGFELLKAKEFLKKNEIKYHDINSNVEGLDFDTSRKIYYDVLIDDRNLGTKIDWEKIKQMVEQKICEKAAPTAPIQVNVEELIKQIVFAKCSYSLVEPEQKYQAQCRKCHQVFDLPVTKKQIEDWKSGTLIQRAMPNLKPDQRELLISGLCGKCWDKLFKESASTKELYLKHKTKAEAIFKRFLADVIKAKINLPYKGPKPERALDSGQVLAITIDFFFPERKNRTPVYEEAPKEEKDWNKYIENKFKQVKDIAKKHGLVYEEGPDKSWVSYDLPKEARWKSGPAKEGY